MPRLLNPLPACIKAPRKEGPGRTHVRCPSMKLHAKRAASARDELSGPLSPSSSPHRVAHGLVVYTFISAQKD